MENDPETLCKFYVYSKFNICRLHEKECPHAGFGRLVCSEYYAWRTHREDQEAMEND